MHGRLPPLALFLFGWGFAVSGVTSRPIGFALMGFAVLLWLASLPPVQRRLPALGRLPLVESTPAAISDKLAEYLARGRSIYQRSVQADDELERWQRDYSDWLNEVADWLEVDVSRGTAEIFRSPGAVTAARVRGAYDGEHNSGLLQLEARLRVLRGQLERFP
jgi:hypothetical protein